MFEDDWDDDDDLTFSEAEEWYDDNLRFFDWKNSSPGLPLGVELFYYSVYKPFKQELKKPLTELIGRHFPHIGTETRPEVLERIEKYIDFTGHEFLLFLRGMFEFWKTGKDLREKFPELDKWAESYAKFQRPHYLDESLWDNMHWLTPEQKAEMIAESRKESEELFAFKEKPRFEFFELLQGLTFKYYREIQDIDTDGWTMYRVFMYDEYFNYRYRFEHYETFIEYEFAVEDLDLPYDDFMKKLSKKMEEKRNEKVSEAEN
jgi:hypothetical protein